HTIIPDRIEAGTFLIAGAMTRGDLLISGCDPQHLSALVGKMRQAGAEILEEGPHALRVKASRRMRAADITTEEFPGFATDLQAQYIAMMCVAEGISIATETIF